MEKREPSHWRPFEASRRQLIKFGIGGATLFAPGPWASAWAQSSQGSQLLKLPKIALVIGNGQYKQSPLRNPANDAKGMADVLNSLGFEVTVRLEAGKAAMQTAIDAYVTQLVSRKCVGLFYFAGHGIQINWKNYLLPADAEVGTNEDVEARGIELNKIIEGLNKAGNALNLIILDACRDAPFGEAKKPDQKGLSQMDAPRSTLLAYATAPGNVASDGEGSNGLYTESLLREIKTPEAKVEDVFKRVRLNVRRKSNGAQIPWESTSLEDDFYFVPPANLAPPTDKEKERRFTEELRLWEKIERATITDPLEEYLRRYPSGNFSELAQLRLDRLLERLGERPVAIAPQQDNPYTAGTIRADTAFRIGDTFAYRVVDAATRNLKRRFTRTATAITDSDVIFNGGTFVTDLLGNVLKTQEGLFFRSPQQLLASEYTLGKAWSTRYDGRNNAGNDFYSEYTMHVSAKESVSVPAGSFNAFVVEATGGSRFFHLPSHARQTWRIWVAPDQCRMYVRRESKRMIFYPRGVEVVHEIEELESYRHA